MKDTVIYCQRNLPVNRSKPFQYPNRLDDRNWWDDKRNGMVVLRKCSSDNQTDISLQIFRVALTTRLNGDDLLSTDDSSGTGSQNGAIDLSSKQDGAYQMVLKE
jgi:hypothetical protein